MARNDRQPLGTEGQQWQEVEAMSPATLGKSVLPIGARPRAATQPGFQTSTVMDLQILGKHPALQLWQCVCVPSTLCMCGHLFGCSRTAAAAWSFVQAESAPTRAPPQQSSVVTMET